MMCGSRIGRIGGLAFLAGVLWTSPGEAGYIYRTFDVPGSSSTTLAGINNTGQLAGSFDDALGSHGFTKDADGTLITFDESPAAINQSGQVVGLIIEPDQTNVGFIRNTDGTVNVFLVPGSGSTTAYGINGSGQVVGLFGDTNGTHGYIRGADGLTYTTIDVPGSGGTVAAGINNSGLVTGYYRLGRNFRGFTRGLDGTLMSFDAPGSNFIKPIGINDSGEVTGFFVDSVGAHGFVRGADGLSFATLDVPGSTLTIAGGINDLGQIVGYYDDANGNTHGFIASSVPEPSPAILLGTGALAVLVAASAGRRLRRPSETPAY